MSQNKKGRRITPATFFEHGGGGNRTRGSKTPNAKTTKTYETAKQQLTPQLTPKSQKQSKIDTAGLSSDLVEIVDVWPSLPEPVKAGVLAMVKAYVAQQSIENGIPNNQ